MSSQLLQLELKSNFKISKFIKFTKYEAHLTFPVSLSGHQHSTLRVKFDLNLTLCGFGSQLIRLVNKDVIICQFMTIYEHLRHLMMDHNDR